MQINVQLEPVLIQSRSIQPLLSSLLLPILLQMSYFLLLAITVSVKVPAQHPESQALSKVTISPVERPSIEMARVFSSLYCLMFRYLFMCIVAQTAQKIALIIANVTIKSLWPADSFKTTSLASLHLKKQIHGGLLFISLQQPLPRQHLLFFT